MDRQYWETIATKYEAEIFDVFTHDQQGLIRSHIEALASPGVDVADLGCGIGRWLPFLAARFRRVLAIDLSHRCLQRARRACRRHTNIEYLRLDLAHRRPRLPRVRVVICVNAILMPSPAKRLRLFHTLGRQLLPGGHLVLVVPSLESALLTHQRLIEWNLKDGRSPASAHQTPLRRWQRHALDIAQGVIPVDRVRTKHYLREELEILLRLHDLRVLETTKIEYPWTTEFTQPPRWMKAPHPWDWLVVARKRPAAANAGCTRRKRRYP